MYYVYFLEMNNGDIYAGSTPDLRRRFESHQNGQVISTSKYLPVTLKAYVAVETQKRARELEKYFKTGSGKAVARKRFLS
ncbi:MAG: GIY-YIG nuclease family protein [Rickettsiales bacterium]